MVTAHHEVLHRIFQERREILVPALRLLNVSLPEDAAVVDELSPDCSTVEAVERRADMVLSVSPPGSDRFVLAIESQGRKAMDKPHSWAYYASFLMAKHGIPAQLLVLCSNPATAKWAQGPFPLGLKGHETLTVSPWVLGPDNVPRFTDPDQAARQLPIAALSVLVHREDTEHKAIMEAVSRALGNAADVSVTVAKHYMFMIEAGLDGAARHTWRRMMSEYFPGGGPMLREREREIRSEGEARGEARGRAEGEAWGKAESVLRVLEHRGVAVPETVRRRVTGCLDLDALNRWFDRAFQVSDAEDLFVEDA